MRRICFMVAALLAGSAGAAAAEPSARLEEVVVTATKTEERVRDVPNAVVIKESGDIEAAPATSIGELLANEPGLDWRTRGNYGGAAEEIQIRGLGGDATQVFLNGVNINSPSFGTADLGRLPLHGVERVEVVKGSGSLLYGTGAAGGTVHVVTKSPRHGQQDLRVRGGIGSQGSHELAAEQGLYLSEEFGYYLTAGTEKTDGFRDNSDLDHKDASLKILYGKDERLQATLYCALLDRAYGLPGVKPPDGTREHVVNGVRIYSAEAASTVNRGGNEDLHSVLEVKGRPLAAVGLTLRGEYSEMESYSWQRSATLTATGSESWVTNTVSGLEGVAEWQALPGATLLVGGQYRDYGYENKQGRIDTFGAPVAGSVTEAAHSLFTRGLYAEAQYRPNDFLKVLAGLRHEEHARFGSETLPRFGLVFNPLADTAIKLNHGKHFKAPTMNDLYWPDTGYQVGNPDLRPETGWHSDLTLEQRLFADRLELSLSCFTVDIDDKIDWAEDPSLPTAIPGKNYWTPSNISAFKSRGWEMGLTARPLTGMWLTLGYTHAKAEEEKSPGAWREALYNARHLAKGELGYDFAFGLTATAMLRYVGHRPAYYAANTATAPLATLDSYTTTDVALNQRLSPGWLLSLRCGNIFDQGYDTYLATFRDLATATTTRQGYPGAGRSLFLGLAYEF